MGDGCHASHQPVSLPIKLDQRKIFTQTTTPLGLAKNFETRMLTHDLFAVANLLVNLYSVV